MNLEKVRWEQSPLAKIDIIYKALKFKVADEVDIFWEGSNRFNSAKERNIDIDNLKGITIYLVWAIQNPTILVDCFLTTEFLSRGTKLSTRTLFLDVLKASIDFLLDMTLSEEQLLGSISENEGETTGQTDSRYTIATGS